METQEILFAGASLLISIIALLISIGANLRSRDAARAEMFIVLRSKYSEIQSSLPKEYSEDGWRAQNKVESAAIKRYWHHCFDEWYLTSKSNRRYLNKLWAEYFAEGITEGLKYEGFWEILEEMSEIKSEPNQKNLWQEFFEDMKRLKKGYHS